MNRLALNDLKRWFNLKDRKPLVLRGARQVGKSTLVRLFAEQLGFDLIEINFEKTTLRSLKNPTDISLIIQEVEVLTNKRVTHHSLIFFDEIQKTPEIFQSLRYFYEEKPLLPVIAAGSLLEFILDSPAFDVPVGRIQYYHLGPMSFYEFLEAAKRDTLLQALKNSAGRLPPHLHFAAMKSLSEFFFVGGMPRALQTYLDSQNMLDVRLEHQSILDTYKDDFNKYGSKKKLPFIEKVFDRISFHLGQKVKYSNFHDDLNFRQIKESLELLKKARLISYCRHTNASGLPLRAQSNDRIFKIFFLDIGLMNALQGTQWNYLQSGQELTLLTKGLMAEQFVAQHLAYRLGGFEEPELYYWLRDKTSQKAEVDFVVAKDGKIVPVEVKAGSSGRLKSLQIFSHEKNIQEVYRFDAAENRESIEDFQFHLTLGSQKVVAHLKIHNLHLAQIQNF